MIPSTTLRERVEKALDWAPDVSATRIGVAAENGIVTLTGHVPSYVDKTRAERVVKRVRGVRAVANDLEIDIPGDRKYTDTEIAEAVVNALRWSVKVPDERITATVREGWVVLEGEVDWRFQRQAAFEEVHDLHGVRGVDNLVAVRPPATDTRPAEVKRKIEEALVRDARLDANKITVETKGHTVVLRGTVDSLSDREEIEDAAWAVPGVAAVEDHLEVGTS